MRVFEPTIRTKANGQYRLLICDGHDSHLLQPVDVAIFGLLKKRLTAALQHLNEAQLVRIQKQEWMEAYI
jgi:hypothetical protein